MEFEMCYLYLCFTLNRQDIQNQKRVGPQDGNILQHFYLRGDVSRLNIPWFD